MEKELTKTSENNKCFNFFLKHPGVFVSLISGIVIAISCILYALIYIKEYRELQKWGFDSKIMDVDSSNHIYVLGGICVCIFVNLFFERIMDQTFQKYLLDIKKALYIDSIIHNLKMRFSECKNQKKRPFLKISREDKEILRNIKAEIKNCKIKNRKYKKKYRLILLASFILSMLFSVVITTIMFFLLKQTISIIEAIIYALIYAVFVLAILPLFNYIGRKIKIMRNYREENKSVRDMNELFSSISQEDNSDYVLNNILKMEFREFFTDRGIVQMIISMLISLCVFFLMLIPIPIDLSKTENDLMLVNNEGKTYVIIYQSEDSYYLEEATLNGREIIIHMSKQKMISKDNVSYTIVRFESSKIHKNDWREKKTN